jgi:hypothetical protein
MFRDWHKGPQKVWWKYDSCDGEVGRGRRREHVGRAVSCTLAEFDHVGYIGTFNLALFLAPSAERRKPLQKEKWEWRRRKKFIDESWFGRGFGRRRLWVYV